ncbi:hypothetical protein LAV77_02280 [Priestia megaterium]|uniref:hypothetical protein n=1 Tax=Priestia megaterium TaxID=1404 RepID=UPI00048DC2AD|nr:hypothetical protein [Priestia megaterium]MEB2263612.1 hypothetical protein [Priestia megaterium]
MGEKTITTKINIFLRKDGQIGINAGGDLTVISGKETSKNYNRVLFNYFYGELVKAGKIKIEV